MPRRKIRDKLFSPPVLVPLCALCGECFSAAVGVPGSLPAGSLFGLQFGKEGEVFLCETGQGQQLGAIAPRFSQGHFAAPAADLLMVAAQQHLGHAPTAKLRRPRVVRVIQNARWQRLDT